ncbi:MAG TPA: DUF4129 domain-containing protein [Candidatus Acidoferrum sp.]|nr:DUF4129 domain-containing protein [Candidatus Acidoferrum sp.]
MKRRDPQSRASALNLLDESVHVLRTAPPTALLAYFAGTAPFVLALLFFWSDMSRSAFAENHLVGGALGLALLFTWMKVWQSIFAGIVRTHVSREVQPRWTLSRAARFVARQLVIQPSGLFLLPATLIAMLPFGWTFAFYQNVTVLGARGDESLRRFIKHSWREAKYEPIQNHTVIFTLLFFALIALVNLAISVFLVPQLLKMLLGIDTPFTLSAESALNTTFVAVIFGVTYLCVDPLLKTVYVLRCFYGESRQSGEDLRVGLRKFSTAGVEILAAVLLLMGVCSGVAGETSPTSSPAKTINPTELNQSIDEVLRKPEYTWRGPRLKYVEREEHEREWKFLKRVAKSIQNGFDWMGRVLEKIFGNRGPTGGPGGFSLFSKQGLAYALIIVVAIAIGALLYFIWRVRIKKRAAVAEAQVAVPPPDLADDNVTAEQLPEDGWLRLGIEMLERGDLRLALRAFYLASLAHLAERNLVTLAKFKSNRDYERELLRRSHALPEVAQLFSENVFTFDRVWYGLHDVTSDLLQRFRVNVERIKSC